MGISSKPACQPNRRRKCRFSCGWHCQGRSDGSFCPNIRCFFELQHRFCRGSDSPPSSTLRVRRDAIRCLQHCNALLLLVQTHASSATNTVAWRAGLLDSGRILMIRYDGRCGALLAPVKHSVCLAPARQKGGPMGYPWALHTHIARSCVIYLALVVAEL